MSPRKEFNQFIGMIIKDPQRLTDDTDPNGEKIYEYARDNGLHVQFHKAGGPRGQLGLCVVSLNVTITKEGVPEDQKAWGWRVSGMNIR